MEGELWLKVSENNQNILVFLSRPRWYYAGYNCQTMEEFYFHFGLARPRDQKRSQNNEDLRMEHWWEKNAYGWVVIRYVQESVDSRFHYLQSIPGQR